MSTKQNTGELLYQEFLQALYNRKFEECHLLLAKLQTAEVKQPADIAQVFYLEGLLANEEERDAAKAERLFTLSLEQEQYPVQRARTLRALGIAYEYQNLSDKSLETFRALLAIYENLNLPLEQAKTLKNIAIACENGYARGDLEYEQLLYAEACCQRALLLFDTLDDPSPALQWDKSTTWNSLGAIYLHLERWDEAIACYQRHLAYATKHDDTFSIAIAKLNLGEIYQLQGKEQWAKANECYIEALNLFHELDDSYEKVGVSANLAALYQQMGEPIAALNYYEQAIALAEQMRVGVTSESGRAGYFAAVEALYANAILFYVEQGQLERAFDLTELARARAFLDRLAVRSVELARSLFESVITLCEVQTKLPNDALLLAYFTTGLLEPQADGRDKRPGVKRHRFPLAKTLLFAVTTHQIQVHDLQLSPNLLRPNHLENVVERHFLSTTMLRTLYQKLIQPVESLLWDKQQLYLLPHGPLHYIPFQALTARGEKSLLHTTSPTLIYAPNATTLFSVTNNSTIHPAASLLSIGYNAEGTYDLAYAEDEARFIAHLTGGTSLTGVDSKRTFLYDAANRFRFLHFSCHGEFDPTAPLESFLLTGAQEQLTAQQIIDHLHLDCDLVTLSACESGLSRIRRGDEMMGLLRAFFYAGAQALLATLWRVDERATYLIMQHFYKQVQAGQDFAVALKNAQLYLRNLTYAEAERMLGEKPLPFSPIHARTQAPYHSELPFADPLYWAAFVLFRRGLD